MAYRAFESDSLLFTDADRLGGGLINAASGSRATILTGPAIKAIESAVFNDGPAPHGLAQLFDQSALRTLGIAPAGAAQQGAPLAGVALTDKKPDAEPVQSETHPDEGVISLNGRPGWRPAGTVRSRKVGGAMVHFVVSPQSLVGKVRAVSEFAAMHVEATPQIRVEGSSCSSCGTCGACGACALCLEANVATAAVAVVAISTAVNLGAAAFTPATDPGQPRRTLTGKQQETLSGLQSLLSSL